MFKKFSSVLLLLIVLLSFFLRTYKVTEIPPGINRDEGSIGYTAYSLIKTGADEYGKAFPLSFESFGDWKLPLYIYGTTFFVWIMGLSELSVRILSIIAGVTAVFLTYFLVKKLLKNEIIALLTSFLVAISPWHLHLSRVESESNTAVTFTIIAVLFFLKSLDTRHWFIVLSGIFFALTYFTYAGNHISTTLLILGIAVLYWKDIPKTKWTALAVFIFTILFGVITYSTLFGASKTKIGGISIFGDPAIIHSKIEIPRNEHNVSDSFFARFTHNKLVFSLERIAQNYLNSFSPDFLFIKGGSNKAHNIATIGNMYLVEAVFFYFGAFYLIFIRKKSREENLILWWLLIAPIAASITKDAPHTNRMFAIFPILPLMTAIGIYNVFKLIQNYRIKIISLSILIVLFVINFSIYMDRYFVHFPKNESINWGLGYKELNRFIDNPKYNSYKVIVSNPEYSPYIFLAFYQKFDPSEFKKTVTRYPYTDDRFLHVKGYDRFEFREIDWKKDTQISNRLLVEFSSKVPKDILVNYQNYNIYLPDSSSMFTIVETK